MKISIIGAGNMGGAIARGIAAKCGCDVSVTVANPTKPKLDKLLAEYEHICVTTNNIHAVEGADIIILAVKPWILPGVVAELKPHLDYARQAIISVAGGVSLDDLDQMLNRDGELPALFHVIPDTAIAVSRSMTFIATRRASQELITAVTDIFKNLGEVAVIESRLMGAATALSSCGIAYVYKFVQACVQAGVQLGFYPHDALRYVNATVDGAIAMLRASDTTPQAEIDRVTTPGGLTIKGINELEHCGFTSAVINAILKPLQK